MVGGVVNASVDMFACWRVIIDCAIIAHNIC